MGYKLNIHPMKTCPKCKVEKSIDSFSKNSNLKDGLNCWCRACIKLCYDKNKWKYKERVEKYSRENKEKISINSKKSYQNNKGKRRKDNIIYNLLPENRAKRLLTYANQNARRRGWEINIDTSDIVIPEFCPYLGVKLTHQLGQGIKKYNSSIDRIDSTKGYIKGNIQVISRLANCMKQDATQEQLITFAKNILSK